MKRPHAQPYHPSDEEIASFIDGSMGQIDDLRVRAHLQGCEDCLEAYRYAVRYSGAHGETPAADLPSTEALQAARAIAQPDRPQHTHAGRGKRRWLGGMSPASRAVMAAAAVVFVATAVWLRPIPGGDGFDPHSPDLAPVTLAMTAASDRNTLVLPGVEFDLGAAPATVRSGPAPITRELDNALSRLAVAYNDGALASDEAQWLIAGYLATGQVENARVYIEDARVRYPKDLDLVILEGILAYNDDDLGRAEGSFEAVLTADAGNALAAFNLAVVRAESGDPAGARLLFSRVQELAPGSTLAGRAAIAVSVTP